MTERVAAGPALASKRPPAASGARRAAVHEAVRRRNDGAGRPPPIFRQPATRCACGGITGPEGECEECRSRRLARGRDAEPRTPGASGSSAQRMEGDGKTRVVPAVVQDVLSSPGVALDADVRASFESRFGFDFSHVRVHTDSRSAESAKAIDASAYTVGRDVFFGAGQYAPASDAGQQLIAHELAHVAQQVSRRGTARSHVRDLAVTAIDDPSELQAAEIASGAMPRFRDSRYGGPAPPVRSERPSIIQRSPAGRSPRSRSVSRAAPIVGDGERLGAGQMHKTEFLARLYGELMTACNAELGRSVGRQTIAHTSFGRSSGTEAAPQLCCYGRFASGLSHLRERTRKA